MTTIAILPVPTDEGGVTYHAKAGGKRSQGRTIGEALDALTAQLPDDGADLLVVVQSLRPDRFFTAARLHHLRGLLTSWRLVAWKQAGGTTPVRLSQGEVELDAVIEAEALAAANRATLAN